MGGGGGIVAAGSGGSGPGGAAGGDGCFISGTHYANGVANPANACQTCQPGYSTQSWTALSDGSGCGTGLVCSGGICQGGCWINGALVASGITKTTNVCQICQPVANSSNWSNIADGSACGSGSVCHAGTCQTGCYVGGTVYSSNSLNSANSCQICAPGISTSAWYQPPSDCATMAAHDSFSCAVASGVAKCWGSNGNGRGTQPSLGTGESYDQLTNSPVPLMVIGLGGNVQAVSTGPDSYHACAVVNGGVKCWGDDSWGQLGDGNGVKSDTPVQVVGLTSGVEGVATGALHTCALVNGHVQCWGDNSNGQLGVSMSSMTPATPVLTGAQAIAVGAYHTCALVSGTVWCWGENAYGELGNDSTTDSSVPVQVTALGSTVQVIAAGGNSTCAIAAGQLWCWGSNNYGQLGDGTATDRSVPVAVQNLPSGVQAVSTSSEVTCAVVNGAAWCWGAGGLLGDNTDSDRSTPGVVTGLESGVLSITVGSAPCAVTSTGVKCWGYNGSGELGANSTVASSLTPVAVQGL